MNDIHDIQPPVFVGFNPTTLDILLIVAGMALICLLLWFLFRLYKKGFFQKKNKKALLLPPPLPPEEIAATELKSILELMDKDRRLFYFRLTAILKRYINRRFKLNAMEMTSQELIRSINTLNLGSDLLLQISEFLKFSDNIKYAAMPALKKEVEKDFNKVKNFIDITTKQACEKIEKEEK